MLAWMKKLLKRLRPPKNTSSTVTAGSVGNETLGVFYNSYDKMYHICKYIPYKKISNVALCGKDIGHWTATGGPVDLVAKRFCPACGKA